MAKSLRSKWRRKMKAEKRTRYGAKENERLIRMLEQAGDYQVVQGVKKEPVDEPLEVDESPLDTSQVVEILQTNSNATTTTTTRSTRSSSRSRSRHDQRRLSRRSRRDDGDQGDDSDGNGESKEDETDNQMDVTKDKVERVYNKRTKKDQFGNYPTWFSLRKIGKQKKRNKKIVSKAYKLKNRKK